MIKKTLYQTVFLVALPFGILRFLLPVYGQEIGASAVEIGLFFTVFSLMLVVLRPVIGMLIDRYGRRRFYIAGLLGYGLTMIGFAVADNVGAILLVRAVQGAASATLWLSLRTIVADVAGEDERGQYYGGVGQRANQGAALGAIVGFTVLVQATDDVWTLLFVGYGLAAVGAAFLAFQRLPETKTPETADEEPPQEIQWTRAWMLLLMVTLVTAASWSMVSPILVIFLSDQLNADVPELAQAYLPAALVWATLPRYLGQMADRFGRKRLILAGLTVGALSSFVIPALSSLGALAALWAIQALAYAAGDPAEQALVADLTDGKRRGRAFGLYSMAGSLGVAIGPPVGGLLYDHVSHSAPFILNGIVLVLALAVLWQWLDVPDQSAVAASVPSDL